MNIKSGKLKDEDAEYENELGKARREKIKAQEELMKNREIEYKRKLERDRLELLKQRQGITEEKVESSLPKPIAMDKPTGRKAVENFWYHYKIPVIVVILLMLIGSFLVYNVLTKVKADINILYLLNDEGSDKQTQLEALIQKRANDINNDGKVVAQSVFIPLKEDSTVGTYELTIQTKLTSVFQAGSEMLVISNSLFDERFKTEDVFEDFTKVYPDNKYITTKGFKLSSEKVKKALDWDDMPDDIYLSVRKPIKLSGQSQKEMEEQYESAKSVFIKMVDTLS